MSIDPAKRKDAAARKEMMRDGRPRRAVPARRCRQGGRRTRRRARRRRAADPRRLDRASRRGRLGLRLSRTRCQRRRRRCAAKRVANPGCYPTGAIALIRPLVDAGLIPADQPRHHQRRYRLLGRRAQHDRGLRGRHRAGVRALRARPRAQARARADAYAGLTRRPIFVPSVGNFRQGMLVSIPLHLDTLPGKPRACATSSWRSTRTTRRRAGQRCDARGDGAPSAAESTR